MEKAQFTTDTADATEIITVENSSTLIKSANYFPDEKILELTFHTSTFVYKYVEVPPEVFNAFIAADSLGRFYNEQIKGVFDSISS